NRVARLMADEARAGIAAHLVGAAPFEAILVRIEGGANPRPTVTGDAVSLGVAAHAGVQVSLGLERMAPRLTRRVAPDDFRGMKAPRVLGVDGARLGHSDAH